MDRDQRAKTSSVGRSIALATLLVVSCVVFFFGLGSYGLNQIDEAWLAQVAREMADQGSIWHPTFFGGPFFLKPAAPLWLMAGGYRLVGVNPFSTRVWAALFAVAAVAATFRLGERIGGAGVGVLAGVALVTTYPFVFKHCGRSAGPDSLMVFLFVLASLLLLRAAETGRGWIAVAAVAAMSSHAKNFAGVVPALVVVLAVVLGATRHRPTGRRWLVGGAVFVLVNLVWIVPMAMIHGAPFVHAYFAEQVVGRPTVGGALSIPGAVLAYLRIVVVGFFPWGILGLAGVVEEVRRAAARRDTGSVLVLCWLVVLTTVMIALLRRPNQWYVLPLLPFLTVSGARLLVGADPRPRWARWWQVVSCAVVCVLAAVVRIVPESVPFALWNIQPLHIEFAPVVHTASVLLVGGVAAAVWFAFRGETGPRAGASVAAAAAVLVVAAGVAVVRPLTRVDYENSYERACSVLRGVERHQQAPLVVNVPTSRFGVLAHYYFADLPGYEVQFLRNNVDQAFALLRRVRRPAFVVLVCRDAAAKTPRSWKVLLRSIEPDPSGRAWTFVTVCRVDPEPGVRTGTRSSADADGAERMSDAPRAAPAGRP